MATAPTAWRNGPPALPHRAKPRTRRRLRRRCCLCCSYVKKSLAGGGQVPLPASPWWQVQRRGGKPPLVVDPERMASIGSVTNINDVLEGHVALEVECVDRLLLNAYVPGLQVGGQVSRFITGHLGKPIAS